jgi:hypothetical protein
MPRATRYSPPVRDDRAFIEDPLGWPQYPFMPVKRRGGQAPDLGLLMAVSDQERFPGDGVIPIILTINLFQIGDISRSAGVGTTKELYRHCLDNNLTLEYPSLRDLLADGWVVD